MRQKVTGADDVADAAIAAERGVRTAVDAVARLAPDFDGGAQIDGEGIPGHPEGCHGGVTISMSGADSQLTDPQKEADQPRTRAHPEPEHPSNEGLFGMRDGGLRFASHRLLERLEPRVKKRFCTGSLLLKAGTTLHSTLG